jgi:hypothetical protein
MTPKIDTIYTFKLASGEEIVAKITEIADDHFMIQNPILAVLSPQGLQMMPAMFSANPDKIMRLNTGSWTMIAETRDDVRNSWIQATTGIAPVSKQIITG